MTRPLAITVLLAGVEAEAREDEAECVKEKVQRALAKSQAECAAMRTVLVWLDALGGLGHELHATIAKVITDSAPAASAHDERVRAEMQERCAKVCRDAEDACTTGTYRNEHERFGARQMASGLADVIAALSPGTDDAEKEEP